MIKSLHILFSLFLITQHCYFSQIDSSFAKPRSRKIILATSSGVIAGGSLVYLSKAWYLQYNTGKFHFFNDNGEWLQMDKVGHYWTTYNTGRLMMDAFDWAGFSKKQKLIYGGGIGFAFMTCIEVMDGFSKGWGFSNGDVLANTLGTGAAITQEALWNEQRIFFKYNYHQSGFADYNPNLLGKTFTEKLLKDYNGQIYWLSFSPFNFVKSDKKMPKWLALSVGYGASGMVRGNEDFITYTSPSNPTTFYTIQFERIRNYYFSIDVDFTKIPVKSKFLKTLFTCLNMVKIPSPTLSFNKYRSKYYWFR